MNWIRATGDIFKKEIRRPPTPAFACFPDSNNHQLTEGPGPGRLAMISIKPAQIKLKIYFTLHTL